MILSEKMAETIQWNIRGLKTQNYFKIKKCMFILEQVQNTIIFNLQETRLQNDSDIPKALKNYKHLYHIIGSHAKNDDKGAGILMFVNKTEEILESEEICPGRLIYLKIQNKVTLEQKNIFSFYGKSHASSNEIKGYVSAIINKVSTNILNNIIILGDLNFVTSTLDRNSNTYTAADIMYKNEWNKLEIQLGMMDSFRVTNPKRRFYTYTHTNGISKARLDRIYVSNDLLGLIESTKMENAFESDHRIVRLKLAKNIETGPGQWIFNNTLLKNEIFANEVKKIIKSFNDNKDDFHSNKIRWEFLKQNIVSYARNFASQKCRREKEELNRIKRKLEILESIPRDEITERIKKDIADLKVEENEFTKIKMQGSILRAKLPHIEENEHNISYYAKLEKMSADQNKIYSLKDSQGELKEGTENVIEIVHKFYSELYTNERENIIYQNELLNGVTKFLTPEDREDLDKDMSFLEMKESMSDLKKDKSPGSDGLTK